MVGGLVATVAIPAFAATAGVGTEEARTIQQMAVDDAQTFVAASDANASELSRGSYAATTAEEIEKKKAEEAVAERARQVAKCGGGSGGDAVVVRPGQHRTHLARNRRGALADPQLHQGPRPLGLGLPPGRRSAVVVRHAALCRSSRCGEGVAGELWRLWRRCLHRPRHRRPAGQHAVRAHDVRQSPGLGWPVGLQRASSSDSSAAPEAPPRAICTSRSTSTVPSLTRGRGCRPTPGELIFAYTADARRPAGQAGPSLRHAGHPLFDTLGIRCSTRPPAFTEFTAPVSAGCVSLFPTLRERREPMGSTPRIRTMDALGRLVLRHRTNGCRGSPWRQGAVYKTAPFFVPLRP